MEKNEMNELISYDPDSGFLTWKKSRVGPVNAGCHAGSLHRSSGYAHVVVNGRRYQSHRVAWLLYHGEWPKNHIDHINGIKTDNRISNLRDVTRRDNQRNMSLNKNNSSGIMGVQWIKRTKRWSARIGVNGRPVYLGEFKNIFDAAAARISKQNELGFHKNHGRKK